MESGAIYSKDLVSGGVRLQLSEGVNEKSLEEIKKGAFDLLWLYYGNFEAMQDVHLEGLTGSVMMQSSEPQDISWISRLESVSSLSVRGKVKGKVNFSKLTNLEKCDLEWGRSTKDVICSGLHLRSLSLSKFSGSLGDFDPVTANELGALGLTGGLGSLSKISRFKNLDKLSLWNMRNLQDISELGQCESLRRLQIEGCNSIEYKDVLKNLENLEELFYENKELSSLHSLPMKKLELVVLGAQTRIIDENVVAFLDFPVLKKVTFTKKKGYQYSAEQIMELIDKRN